MTDAHEEKKTITVDVEIPEHADRTETSIYRNSRKALFHEAPLIRFQATAGECFICGKTEKELGAPLQSHHFGVERCFAEADLDWERIKQDFPEFRWGTFDPADPYQFVDDMTAQGMLLCEEHHIGRDSGIHFMPFPLWLIQRYLKPGAEFSPTEIISRGKS